MLFRFKDSRHDGDFSRKPEMQFSEGSEKKLEGSNDGLYPASAHMHLNRSISRKTNLKCFLNHNVFVEVAKSDIEAEEEIHHLFQT